MWRQKIDTFFHRYKLVFSCLCLGINFYFIFFTWYIAPSFSLNIGWKDDLQLIVLDEIVEPAYLPYLQPGDVILSIEGRAVQRGELFLPYPQPTNYEIELLRSNEYRIENVPNLKSSHFIEAWIYSTLFLSIAFWFVGTLIVSFATQQQKLALYAGFGFQFISAGIVSPAPTQLGAPGGWVIGDVLIFLFPTILVYLSLLPQTNQLSKLSVKILQVASILSIVGIILSIIESILLFPNTNFKQVTGFDRVVFLTLFTGISGITSLIILFIRFWLSPHDSYARRQIGILLTFFSVAIIPLLLFAVFPVADILFVPFPFLYSLLLFIPIGYFHAFHRAGYLILDTIATRIITFVILIFAFGMAYMTGVYFIDTVIRIEVGEVTRGGLFLFFVFVGVISRQRIHDFTESLFFGNEPLSKEAMQELPIKISQNPDVVVIQQFIQEIASRLNCPQIVILVNVEGCYQQLTSTTTVKVDELKEVSVWHKRHVFGLNDRRLGIPIWVKLLIPIQIPKEQLGLLLLSEPIHAPFDVRQIEQLEEIATVFAYGLQVVTLTEITQSLSKRLMVDKVLNENQVATEIHNKPLQHLSHAMFQLRPGISDTEVENVKQNIRQASKDLRNIIGNLRPSALLKSPEWMVREVVRDFGERVVDVAMSLKIDVDNDFDLDQVKKYALHNIMSEALNNIHKHASASKVLISLCQKEKNLFLTISDNGVGIPFRITSPSQILRSKSFGIADMYWWQSIAGGELIIEPTEPKGTSIWFKLPLVNSV